MRYGVIQESPLFSLCFLAATHSSCWSMLQKLFHISLWGVWIWCIIFKETRIFLKGLYFHILYTLLNIIVKLKISSSMNFLTNKMSLDVFENCIKIEQKKISNVEHHIEMQLILIDDYRLLIVCFRKITRFEQVCSSFPEAVLNICTCIHVCASHSTTLKMMLCSSSGHFPSVMWKCSCTWIKIWYFHKIYRVIYFPLNVWSLLWWNTVCNEPCCFK